MERDKNNKRLKSIWLFGKKYIHMFALAEICILVSYTISVLLPLNLSELTDKVLYREQYDLLPSIIGNYVLLFIIATVFNFTYAFVWQYLKNHYVLDVKNKIFEKVVMAKASFLSSMNSGDIMTRIDSDSDQFIHVIQRNLFHFVNSGIMCSGIIILVAQINLTIAVMLIIAAALPIILTRFCGRFTEKYSKQSREITGSMIGRIYELLKGFREIKLMNAGVWAENQLLTPLKRIILFGNKLRRTDFFVNKGIYLINLSVAIIIYGFSVYLVAREELTVGFFLAIVEYIALLHKKFNWMLRIYLDWFARKISIDRVNEILNQESESQDGYKIERIADIEFRNVSFSYDKKNPVLKDLSFCIGEGHTVGIVGASGNGKTTIISLLLGLYQADGGNICINGISISEINPASLRNKIGVVSQDIMLLEDSVRYNLNLGQHYSDEDIYDALSVVNLLDTITGLPKGLDTVISSTSHNLSGGQKQRLMIARLLLKKPQLIIMDEATSALDIETERCITEYLHTHTKNVTMLVISHRLETIRNCDKILVLNEHGIESSGTHKQLLLESATYNALFGGERI